MFMAAMASPQSSRPLPRSLLRRLPLILLIVAAVLGFIFLGHWLNFEALAQHREHLLRLRDDHYLLTSLGFMVAYAIVVITSVPGALVMTLTGGFLFGLFPGALYNIFAAWSGAMLVFLAARTSLGHDIAARIANRGGRVARFQEALLDNEWSVLFSMRLIPILPYFLTNLVPAFVGVRTRAFAVTTFLGIIPADLIYTALGDGLGEVFSRGETPKLDVILEPKFLWPLIGLAALSFLPFLLRLARRARS